jgi:hypothetical protein
MVQSITAKYILDMDRKNKHFDEGDYQTYVNHFMNDPTFIRQFHLYSSSKDLHKFQDYVSLVWLLITNKICRAAIVKNLYFLVFMQKVDA